MVNIQKYNPKKRKQIQDIQKRISVHKKAFHGDSENCPLKHHFSDGFYIREIFIPKGTVVVGKIHKHAHPNFLMKGKVRVITEYDGNTELEAPLFMISQAGTKRVVLALEDTIWITVHNNLRNTRDLNELENEIIAKDYNEIGLKDFLKEERICLG